MKPKKRSRPERTPAEPSPPSAALGDDLIGRMGLKWTPVAAVLALVFFFWMWLFLDRQARGSVLMLVVSPDIVIGQWFGLLGEQRLPVDLTDRLPIWLAALFILVASFGPGSLLVSLLTKRTATDIDRIEHVALALGAGLNLWSLFILAGGMSVPGALHELWWIWLGLLCSLLSLPLAIWRLLPASESTEATASEEPIESKPAWKTWLAPVAIGLFSLPYFFAGPLPSYDFDVREYHLQAPKEWLQRGRIEFMPHNVYTNMPLGVELHTITATAILGNGEEAWWLGGLTGKLIVALFAPLTALLIWRIGVRTGYASAGSIAAVIYLTLPWVAYVSLTGLNDAVFGYYLIAAWWVWLRSAAEGKELRDWRALVLAGFFAGGAATIKYPALIFVALPMFVETLLRKLGLRGMDRAKYVGLANFRTAAIALVLLLVGLSLGGGLWYVKNALLTGNPVYPLLASRLGGKSRHQEGDARWVKAHAVPQDEQGRRFTATQLASSVSNFAFRGENASPVLVPLAALGLWFALSTWWQKRGAERAALRFPLIAAGASAFVFAAWFLLTHRLDRFLVPVLPLLALLAGFGYVYAKEQAGATIARLFVVVGLLYSFMLIAEGGLRQLSDRHRSSPIADPRWFVALPTLRGGPLTPADQWLREHLQGDEAVLLVGGAAVWDLPGQPNEVSVYYNTCFDDCVLVDWLAGKTTTAEQRAVFEERKVRYVVVDWSELRRYLRKGNYGYDRRFDPTMLDNLVKARVLKEETRLGADATVKDGKRPRPPQQIYRVLTSAEAAEDEAAAARARQKATQPRATTTPKTAPAKSASQSKKDG